MPAEIITQTCPAPECNLLPSDVEQFIEELTAYFNLFESAFRRPEQAKWGKVYLNGLLGDLPRKTTERIALDLGHNVRDLQHFIGQSQWPIEPVQAIHQRVEAQLGEEAVAWPRLTNRAWSNKENILSVWGISTAVRWARWPIRRMGSTWAYASCKGYKVSLPVVCSCWRSGLTTNMPRNAGHAACRKT